MVMYEGFDVCFLIHSLSPKMEKKLLLLVNLPRFQKRGDV